MPLTFTLRKALAPFIFPLSVTLELLVLGLFLLWFTRHQKLGKVAVTAGTLLVLLISLDAPVERLLVPLEYRYPTPLQQERVAAVEPPRWIVVLGGGFTPDSRLPATTQLGATTLARLTEGVRLYKRFPGSRLIVSGGAWYDSGPEAVPMAEVATILGVAQSDVVREDASLDTEDQARLVAPIVGGSRFFLVTSASHMPRAMALFGKRGLRAIPVAADCDTKGSREFSFSRLYPKADNVGRADKAIYEYLGLAWARMRGAI